MTDKIDLSGLWELYLDENMKASAGETKYNDTISLPNSTSNACKGKPNPARETGFLTDAYKFEGNAWFKRSFEINDIANKTVKLFLERTRITSVFVNGKAAGTQDSFVAPHVYDVTEMLTDGENVVEICVSNVGYKTGGGHMTSADTQSNWNGITGEISLQIFGESYVEKAFVKSDIEKSLLEISAEISGKTQGTAVIRAEGICGNEQSFPEMTAEFADGKLKAVYPMPDAKLWSEFTPALYRLSIDIDGDVFQTVTGLRKFSAAGDKFEINGRKTFLRGKHDGMIFPKTGFAPTDVQSWLEVMGISKSYGINHYRFHTCCPPDAAFEAADILGIYLEPQIPFWGTLAGREDENFSEQEQEQEFLIQEGFNIIEQFGNHPSFCMMSMGNELWGSTKRINEIMGGYKAADDRHLYTQGSNNFQWFPNVVENDDFFVGVRLAKDRLIRGSYAMCDAPLGHVQTDRPSTLHDYDSLVKPVRSSSGNEASKDGTVQIQYGTTMKTVKATEADADFIPEIPIVTHEIGQYETFPDFSETEKYTGPLKARNFEVFREHLEEKGMGELWEKFFRASGKLAGLCYKEELEAVFRSKTLAGFQLLDLQDFTGQGTALVGILNAFMENKGNTTREEWLSFCNDTVVLAKFSSYTYQSGDSFDAVIETVNFSDSSIEGKTVSCRLVADGKIIAEQAFTVSTKDNYCTAGTFTAEIPELSSPAKAVLELEIEGTDVRNSYDLWLYPKIESVDLEGTYIFEGLSDEAQKLLDEGKTVLIVPKLSELENSIEGFYCTDFWCYPMFCTISRMMEKPDPVGTMGLLIDNSHPALADFPSEYYSTHQWWEIVSNSRSEILDDDYKDKNIIVRTIDNFERNHVLGLLYEYPCSNGRVVVLNCDLAKLSKTPEGRQFISSITNYCKNK